ncbi:hypothetical protein RCL1_001063 [Eukaryota sp. TZLM3-RCL]
MTTFSTILVLCLITLAFAEKRARGITPEATNYLPNITVTPQPWMFFHDRSVWSSAPVIVNDIVYFHTSAGVNALSLHDGKLVAQNSRIKARGTPITISPYSDKSVIVEEFPDFGNSKFHILDPRTLNVRQTIPKINPGSAASDMTGLYFVDQQVMYRYAFDGVLMMKRSLPDWVDLRWGRVDHGIIALSSSKIYLIDTNLNVRWTGYYPGLSGSSFAANSKSGHLIFSTYEYQQPGFIFLQGIDANKQGLFKFNVTRADNFAQVVFLTIQENGGSVIFGVGATNKDDAKLDLYRIPYFGGSYLEPELLATVTQRGIYQSHVLFPSGKLALSVYDTSIDIWSTVVVLYDLKTLKSTVLASVENNKGLEMIGYAERCVLYTSKGVYNVPNRLHNICF